MAFFENSMKEAGPGAWRQEALSYRFGGPALAQPAPAIALDGPALAAAGPSPSSLQKPSGECRKPAALEPRRSGSAESDRPPVRWAFCFTVT